MDAYTKMDILRCWTDEETEKLLEMIEDSGYRVIGDGDSKLRPTKELLYNSDGKIPYGAYPELEDWLSTNGIPFKRWSDSFDEFQPEIVVFDGARTEKVMSDKEGNAYVDMRALRSIIDMLEDNLELRALVYSNEQWVETDVNNMFRWRMEETVEINTDNDIIDVEVEE